MNEKSFKVRHVLTGDKSIGVPSYISANNNRNVDINDAIAMNI